MASSSKVFQVLFLVAFAVLGCSGAAPQPEAVAVIESSAEFGYTMYDALLNEHVDDEGMVDYAALKADRETLDQFIASLGAVSVAELKSWSTEAQLAFWINAYNAITLKYIVDNYPIQKGGLISRALYPANSIRQIPGVWDKLQTPVAGAPITLDAIEHEVLRKEFAEPRIHMAIVCASIGCPPLRNEPFVAERLEDQLDEQSRHFLAHPDRFRIDRPSRIVYLSPILDWFGEDFVPVYEPSETLTSGYDSKTAAVLEFVSRYVESAEARLVQSGEYTVKFTDYDWSLNEQ